MGISYLAIIGHHLNAIKVQSLPVMMQPESAPELALAVAQLVRVSNVLLGRYNPVYTPVTHDGNWSIPPGGGLTEWLAAQNWATLQWVDANGRPGLQLDVGLQAILVGPGSLVNHWSTFLTEPSLQAAFRQVCCELALLLNSPSTLYVPDSTYGVSVALDLVARGYSLEEIIAWLHEHHGQPAPSINAIYSENHESGTWSGNGYYIDTFAEPAGGPCTPIHTADDQPHACA